MDSVLQGLEGWGRALIQWTAEVNLSAGAVLIGALLVDRVLRGRIGASWRLLLFVAVFLRALLPLDAVVWGVSPGALPLERVFGDASWSVGAPVAASVNSVQASQVAGAATPIAVAWAPIAAAITWALVASLLLAWQFTARRHIARELGCARTDQRVRVPERYPVPVLVHPTLGPAVVGLLHPIVVLPMHIITQLQPDEVDCVLAHERAHVERRDPWLRMALQVTTALLWPIAALWFALARTQQLTEEACDARALRRGSGTKHLDPRTYGEALLSVASTPRLALVAPTFGGGLAARIRAIGRGAPRAPYAVQGAAALVLTIGLVACAGNRAAEETPVEQPAVRRQIKFRDWSPIEESEGFTFTLPDTLIEAQFLIISGPKSQLLAAIPGGGDNADWPRWVELTTRDLDSVLGALNARPDLRIRNLPMVTTRPGVTASIENTNREGDEGPRNATTDAVERPRIDWTYVQFKGDVEREPDIAYTVTYDLGASRSGYLDVQHSGVGEILACLTPGENGIDGEYVLVLMQAKILHPN